MPTRSTLSLALLAFLAASLSFTITGCGFTSVSPVETSPSPLQGISGTVHGGQQAITSATVTLYAPATNGYGNAPAVIVSTTTDSNGAFTLPRPYTCPANSGNVYIEATGGSSGSGSNSAIALVAMLGPCSALTAGTQVTLNEATTVAAAYALAPFATVSTSATGIGTSATNLTGLNNAFGPASNLVNTATGNPNAATALPGMTLPTAELGTLANILAGCVNAPSSTSSGCTSLMTAATPSGGSAPKDTFQAAINIALHPGNNVSTLYPLGSAFAVFQPTLGGAPADFALGIQYTGGHLPNCGFTTGVAIDAQGDAWVGCGTDTGTQGINEISPAGVFLSGVNGYLNNSVLVGQSGGNGIAIDGSGVVDVTAASQNVVFQLNSTTGAVLNKFTPSSLLGPTGIAVDNRTGYIWVANTNNQPSLNAGANDYTGTTVSALTSAGADSPHSPYTGILTGPVDVQIDGSGHIAVGYTANSTNGIGVSAFQDYAQNATLSQGYTGTINAIGSSVAYSDIAFDASTDIWITNGATIQQFNNDGHNDFTPTSPITETVTPISLMFDGLNRLYVSNATTSNFSTPGSITVYTSAQSLLSTATGYTANGTIPRQPYAPTGFDIDSSGNVWVTGNSGSSQAIVTELIGMAAPVTTPKSVSSSTAAIATRP